ncbi:hypothetical protein C3L33_21594, partial [Rhododendron williamsianum]
MTRAGVAGEVEVSGGGKTVVVGVKLDSPSRELLTWALVKVAQSGDRVIALHVLGDNEIVDPEGKSSLLSLVKAFDSVLAVYEGFCNLKQVDLKLKVCRGSSVRKVLVREAKSYFANEVIVGTARKHHTIRSSASVAKYCGRKLPKDCSVLAVDNGKIVFHREASPITNGCGKDSCVQSTESSTSGDGDGEQDNSMALVTVQKVEDEPSSISLLITEMPERKFGWPLLRRAFLPDRQISVVQWAMQLPSRNCFLSAYSKQSTCNQQEDQSSELDGESGAIVLVGADTLSAPSSPSSSRSIPEELEGLHEKYSSTCRLFKYQELLRATSNFIPANLIGKGGSSQVYQGRLPDGKEIAVKILKPSEDVLKEFVLEIEILLPCFTRTSFHFLVSVLRMEIFSWFMISYQEEAWKITFMVCCNKKDPCTFGWSERYKVAVGVAEALEYLHTESAKPVIHRDVKSSNILLSEDFEPQLSDFGLAKWASTTSSHITCTDVAGTFGYLAPEYFMFGKVNDKIDVYAFGVVLLELLSGRKPISNDHPKGQESLVMWAKPILNGGKVAQLLDPSLARNYNSDQMERMVLAATLCIRRAPRARPQMSIVLKLLQGDSEVTKWARQQIDSSDGTDMLDDEAFPRSNLQSHLNLALLDVHEDSLSMSSIEQTVSFEDYLRGRWSRSSSFD